MNLLNIFAAKKNITKWNYRLRDAKYPELERCLYLCYKAYYRKGLVKHCLASIKKNGKIIMPNMKEAIILIRESWKMLSIQKINYCWKKFSSFGLGHR